MHISFLYALLLTRYVVVRIVRSAPIRQRKCQKGEYRRKKDVEVDVRLKSEVLLRLRERGQYSFSLRNSATYTNSLSFSFFSRRIASHAKWRKNFERYDRSASRGYVFIFPHHLRQPRSPSHASQNETSWMKNRRGMPAVFYVWFRHFCIATW